MVYHLSSQVRDQRSCTQRPPNSPLKRFLYCLYIMSTKKKRKKKTTLKSHINSVISNFATKSHSGKLTSGLTPEKELVYKDVRYFLNALVWNETDGFLSHSRESFFLDQNYYFFYLVILCIMLIRGTYCVY